MAKISYITSKQIIEEERLDAESFDSDYIHFLSISSTRSWITLEKILDKCNRGVLVKPINRPSSFFYIKTKDIDGLFAKANGLLNISEDEYKKYRKAQVQVGDVLLNSTGVGSICRPAIWLYPEKALVEQY